MLYVDASCKGAQPVHVKPFADLQLAPGAGALGLFFYASNKAFIGIAKFLVRYNEPPCLNPIFVSTTCSLLSA